MHVSARRAARRLLVAAALTATLAGTAHAQEPEAAAAPSLAITATTTGGPFLVGAKVPIKLTITNSGDADAVGVRAGQYPVSGTTLVISDQEWGPLSLGHSSGPAPTVPAGGSYSATVNAVVGVWTGAPVARFYTSLTGVDPATTDLALPVVDPASGTDTVGGVLFGDVDRDGTPDPGEGLAGVDLVLNTLSGATTAKTDASGRFTFADLPLRVYSLRLDEVPGGWFFHPRTLEIVADGTGRDANLKVRGIRPMSEQLSTTMKFTKYVYNVGDPAEVAVTITNKSAATLTGVKAFCTHRPGEAEPEAGLGNVDMGALAPTASGVEIPAGQARTFTITGTVPPSALEARTVVHVCTIGLADDPAAGNELVTADARVPATPDDLSLAFFNDPDLSPLPSEKLPDLAVGLVDVASGKLVAKGRTDADGEVTFEELPAAPYQIRVYGPWKLVREGGTYYPGSCRYTCAGEAYPISVEPGPNRPEEDIEVVQPPNTTPAVTPAGNTPAAPAPQASPTPNLAHTGANVLGLAALGGLTVLLGLATTLVTRRKRTARA
ncbi:hypothetical protein [Actinokineospora diospyrosa]|uniref:LPXTG-motif cell wall-anchored protein n=1 Tax=Actinokineospora diospyrosa TaxID=103728 RepID=A0ABT1IE16_9PSEU|nr:hypothetical protein [Actinokineospora diospyrosa]MCP2270586.1 hypothetical protein [Actinokineospora diospyrosa]